MARYELNWINEQAKNDPEGFVALCEAHYHKQITDTAETLAQRQKTRPIVLLNGPSSSGKTTTADRLCRALAKHGIHAERISMDDYYLSRGSYEIPWDDENGVYDLESPECMELPLLRDHLVKLARGEEIAVPKFDFANKTRMRETEVLSLEPDEIAIIEGIHSLNTVLMGDLEKQATGISISVASEVDMGDWVFERNQMRFCRRAVRDANFRGATVEQTIAQWKSVRRGERLYIAPYQHYATMEIDSYLPYETCILMNELNGTLLASEASLRGAGLEEVCRAVGSFAEIDYRPYIPETSVLHEFIG